MTTPRKPLTFQVGAHYRLAQLKPGVSVVRQVSHGTNTLSSGSPCCLRTSTLDYETITLNQEQYRRRVEGHAPNKPPCFERTCAGCGWKFWIHVDMNTPASQLRTVTWEARP
ncbi:hypothetical protein [Nocardia salmonicida]|uniref:hypothetical protein n=1 Tax=Nocardia salmonicida TaxID=53431 RepID=UPI0007A538BA|nr:hypothetical protein [Nocardia salmonicida]